MRHAVTILACAGLLGCSLFRQTSDYPVLVRAISELDEPLPGVQVRVAGGALGVTDATGLHELNVPGIEGQRVELAATCPPGYDGPREAPTLALKRMETQTQPGVPARPLELRVLCESKEHVEVVAIRAGQPGLPILLRGRPVAHTGASGTAHVLVQEPVGSAFQLTVDTTSKPELRPENPTRQFTVAQRDAFAVWDQPFDADKKAVVAKKRAKARRITSDEPPEPSPPSRRSRTAHSSH